jgi:hypothetical protein
MALTGRRPAEIFFSASFSLPRKKLPSPALLFDGQLENPPSSRHQFRALPHPRLGRPQETCPGPRPPPIVKELSFPRGCEHHHRPPTPQVRFRRLRFPRPTLETRSPPIRLRRHLSPPASNQKTSPTISSSPRSSAINSSDPMHPSP